MNKIRLVPVLVFALLVVLVSSCKKNKNDPASGGSGNTDLQVYVLDSHEKLVDGAFVTLYLSKSDRDAGVNSVGSDVTGTSGFIYFSEIKPLTYYVTVIRHSGSTTQSGEGDTGVPIKDKKQSALTVVIQ